MDRILRVLFLTRKTMSAKEVAKESELKLIQVQQAIPGLLNRRMIIKETKQENRNDRGPKKPYMKLRDIVYTEKYLNGRRLL